MPKNENYDAWVSAIESAIELLKEKGWDNDSTTYDVFFEGRLYPPKEVYRIAKEVFEKNNPNEHAPNLGGGVPTNQHLQKFGFSVVKKKSEELTQISLNGKKIYKLSMGTLKKLPPYKGTKIVQNLEAIKIVLIHKNTGKGQADLFANNVEIGDYVYITYGNQLGGIAKITSNLATIPDDFEDKNLLQDWNARKVEHVKLPHNKDARDLKNDQRFWLPSGNSTLYEVPDLKEANKIIFEPYYNITILNNSINPNLMSDKTEENFFNNYYEYTVATKGNIKISTIENYLTTLKDYLSEWCEKVKVDYGDLIAYERKEIYKAYAALNKNEETFSGMMRFQWYIHSLLPEWPLNQILYGPPGTGKTYRTKEMAVIIANPLFEIKKEGIYSEREQIVTEYERLVNEGQIVFTTFHQSMGYEDFIEGIKPETNEKGEITYLVKSGIFKQLCETAEKINESVEEAIEKFKETILENGEQTLSTSRGNKFKVDFSGGTTFRINPENSSSEKPDYPASIDYIKKLHLGKDTTGMYNPSYVKSILAHLKSEYGLSDELTENYNDKDYVLIIDEINRGNVSSIFGELITLLEPDKRKGMDEAVEIKLPYSKDAFSVPYNLYIIGTMNTADRSVEALDTALRRRFSFTEVMPQPVVLENEEVNGINLTVLLSTINKRIEALLDRDHTIGHSYFIKVLNADKKEEKLAEIFRDNIIPLLQEYFYGDYTKIGLVLGEGFVKLIEATDQNIFAPFNGIDNETEVDDSYEIISINDDFDITDALKKLLA